VLPYQAVSTPFWQELDRANGFAFAERPTFKTIEYLLPIIAMKGIPTLITTYDVIGEGVFYSTVRVLDGYGEIRTEYRQAHALNLPGHHERLFFQPGTTGDFTLFTVNGIRIGLLLGGDLWVPEIARCLAIAGVDVLIGIGAFAGEVESKARKLAEARSIEEGLPVLLANREREPIAFGPVAVDPEINDESGWSRISLPISKPADDPLLMRRPRLYSALASGDEGALWDGKLAKQQERKRGNEKEKVSTVGRLDAVVKYTPTGRKVLAKDKGKQRGAKVEISDDQRMENVLEATIENVVVGPRIDVARMEAEGMFQRAWAAWLSTDPTRKAGA
jgi:predicted amidohydrolase